MSKAQQSNSQRKGFLFNPFSQQHVAKGAEELFREKTFQEEYWGYRRLFFVTKYLASAISVFFGYHFFQAYIFQTLPSVTNSTEETLPTVTILVPIAIAALPTVTIEVLKHLSMPLFFSNGFKRKWAKSLLPFALGIGCIYASYHLTIEGANDFFDNQQASQQALSYRFQLQKDSIRQR